MGAEGGFRQARGGGKRRNIGWRADRGGQARGREFGHARIGGTGQGDGDKACDLFERDMAAALPEMDRAADGGVAREGDFRARGEDADLGGVTGIVGGVDEDRLAEVELARQRLHFRVRQRVCAFDDGQRIAGEGRVGEDVVDVEAEHGGLSDAWVTCRKACARHEVKGAFFARKTRQKTRVFRMGNLQISLTKIWRFSGDQARKGVAGHGCRA